MYRKFYQVLLDWKEKNTVEPLMIIGARQVGKTWLIREFCRKEYPEYIYINLEERTDIASIFSGRLDPEWIIRQLEQLLGRPIGIETPIVIDEIQTSERAITSLKYFCESDKNYRIICAGSLLGVKLQRFESSFPVGKVKICKMYPMDFEEFMIACGESFLRDGIRYAYENKQALADGIHEKALVLYHDYLFVGGMPQNVTEYLQKEKKVVAMSSDIQKNIGLAYLADMTKYTTSAAEGVKITEVYQSIPRQLAKENPKFKYNEVRSKANRRDFISSVDWLTASGMICRVNAVEAIAYPLNAYESETSFKVYLSDVGILSSACGFHYWDLQLSEHNIYKGAVVENYVIQQFVSEGLTPWYYKPDNSMEIDLLMEDRGHIIPVEIKSGRHKKSSSLKKYNEKNHPEYCIRFSELNFGWNNNLVSVPLYAVFCVVSQWGRHLTRTD